MEISGFDFILSGKFEPFPWDLIESLIRERWPDFTVELDGTTRFFFENKAAQDSTNEVGVVPGVIARYLWVQPGLGGLVVTGGEDSAQQGWGLVEAIRGHRIKLGIETPPTFTWIVEKGEVQKLVLTPETLGPYLKELDACRAP